LIDIAQLGMKRIYNARAALYIGSSSSVGMIVVWKIRERREKEKKGSF